MQPKYNFDDFKKACSAGSVNFWTDVLSDAAYFSFHTESEILQFIANDGVEAKDFINCQKLDIWTGPPPPPMVDAYHFFSGTKYGYLAFYQGSTGGWIIKSFHEEQIQPDPRNLAFLDLQYLLPRLREIDQRKGKGEENV